MRLGDAPAQDAGRVDAAGAAAARRVGAVSKGSARRGKTSGGTPMVAQTDLDLIADELAQEELRRLRYMAACGQQVAQQQAQARGRQRLAPLRACGAATSAAVSCSSAARSTGCGGGQGQGTSGQALTFSRSVMRSRISARSRTTASLVAPSGSRAIRARVKGLRSSWLMASGMRRVSSMAYRLAAIDAGGQPAEFVVARHGDQALDLPRP